MALKIELLSPAGDALSLKAALLAGADAVYVGGKHFGARAFAPNFDENGLLWARRATRSLNRKLYITLNTLVFDHEFPFLEKILDFYEFLQPDALILQDLGVASLLAKRKSAIPRHLSTQSAWDGFGGHELLKELGFSRVILPRETSLERIKELVRGSGLEIEVFVHGAMCYSISGRCFWSAALGERSGNRGTCAQPCRKSYQRKFGEPLFPFSPRDMRLISRLDELVSTGVRSLKIEGRMKDADYVFQVVKAYRDLLDNRGTLLAGHQKLNQVFSRPFHEGFIAGKPGDSWNTPETSGRQEIGEGKVCSPRRSDGLTEISMSVEVKSGDGIAWNAAGEKDGARLTWVEPIPGKGRHFLVRGLPDLPKQTELHLTSIQKNLAWAKNWLPEWDRQPLDLFWSGHEGQALAVETIFQGMAVRVESEETLVRAIRQGLESGPLQEKFSHLGELFRGGRHVSKALEPGLFISPTGLKKLKRELVAVLTGILKTRPRPGGNLRMFRHNPEPESFPKSKRKMLLRLWSAEKPLMKEIPVDRVIVPLLPDKSFSTVCSDKTGFWLPSPATVAELERFVEIINSLPPQEFLCSGWEIFELKKRLPRHQFRIDWPFNLANRYSVRLFQEKNLHVTAAREWPEKQSPQDPQVIWSVGWNPLVSLSRFPPLIPIGEIVSNSHGDKFFLRQLGTGIFGLFLKSPITMLPENHLSIQVDVEIAPDETPAKVAGELRMLLMKP